MFSSSNRSQNWSVTVLGRDPRILQRLLLCDGDSASFDPAEFSQPGKTQTTPSSQSEFVGFEWKTASPRLILSYSNCTVQYMASLKKKEWTADMALGYFNVPLRQRIVCMFRFFWLSLEGLQIGKCFFQPVVAQKLPWQERCHVLLALVFWGS